MAAVTCTVTSAGGGWSSFGSYPANLNDGDADTYQFTPGNGGGANDTYYDSTVIPAAAVITSVVVSGLWGSGSAAATVNYTAYLGASTTDLGTIGDVSGYGAAIARPGGGSWSKADIATLYVKFTSLATGNGNAIRLKSSALTVYYTFAPTNLASVLEHMV